jgi:CHASE3 domain sensor protein
LLASYEVKAAAAGLAVCLIGISAAVYRASTKLVENARWVAHTHDVLTQLEATATGVTAAETELRGFLLTDQESYLVPYSAGLTEPAAGWKRSARLPPITHANKPASTSWSL